MKISIGSIDLIKFKPEHTRLLYVLRNHPTVRAGLKDTRLIPYRDHRQWVQENLIKEERLLEFIVYYRGQPVGLGLIRNQVGDTAEIGVMIKESERYPQVAAYVCGAMAHYVYAKKQIRDLFSYVLASNEKACQFNRSGGAEQLETSADGMVTFVYRLEYLFFHSPLVGFFKRCKDRMNIVEDTDLTTDRSGTT